MADGMGIATSVMEVECPCMESDVTRSHRPIFWCDELCHKIMIPIWYLAQRGQVDKREEDNRGESSWVVGCSRASFVVVHCYRSQLDTAACRHRWITAKVDVQRFQRAPIKMLLSLEH